MGYTLNAILGPYMLLDLHHKRYAAAHLVPLAQRIAMIPLTDALFDAIHVGSAGNHDPLFGEFTYLSAAVAAWKQERSAQGIVAYVEADFFGGLGSQASVVWLHGQIILGPLKTERGWRAGQLTGPPIQDFAVNQALRALGVSAMAELDEFDAVGLGKHRHTDQRVNG